MSLNRIIGLWGGPAAFFFIILFLDLKAGKPEITYTFAAALWMAIWWITEVVPLAVTSLLPVILFPLTGVMNGKDVSSAYFNHVIFLFIGGFIVALAMQHWNLHKRIAIRILIFIGIGPGRILMGFMLATAFLSMWISNTATAMMMLPIVISIINKLEESIQDTSIRKYSTGLLLGIAYSASVGGIATLVGTPPNLSFVRIFAILFPEAPEISFSGWFLFAGPLSAVVFFIIWLYLYLIFKPVKTGWKQINRDSFRIQLRELGPMSYEEKIVLIHFIVLAILWIFRVDIQLGSMIIPGWDRLFGQPDYINDGTVAILVAVSLFVIPSKTAGSRIMSWEYANKIPWGIVLLFGGGFALASAFKESGLSVWFGEQLAWTSGIHPFIIVAVITFLMIFLTELTSNTATTEMLLPIFAGLAVSTQINPLLFMIPATLAASMAFMLPVATPPNAIIFGTNRITVMQMARTGLLLNFIVIIIITLTTYFYGKTVFDINIFQFPDWAVNH